MTIILLLGANRPVTFGQKSTRIWWFIVWIKFITKPKKINVETKLWLIECREFLFYFGILLWLETIDLLICTAGLMGFLLTRQLLIGEILIYIHHSLSWKLKIHHVFHLIFYIHHHKNLNKVFIKITKNSFNPPIIPKKKSLN